MGKAIHFSFHVHQFQSALVHVAGASSLDLFQLEFAV